MYAWKCWRETRARFCVLLALSIVSVGVFAWVFFGPQAVGMLGEPHPLTPIEIQNQLRWFAMVAVISFSCVVVPGGFLLGSTGMGAEAEQGTAEYLWTRPQRRTSLVLTHWLVCAAELLGVIAIPTLLILLFEGVRYGVWNYWRLPVAALLEMLPGVLFLGLTILMTAIRRSAASGLICSLGLTFGYWGLAIVLGEYTKLHVPGLEMPTLFDWSTQYAGNSVAKLLPAFPWAATLRTGILAWGFVVAAERLIKRAEI